MSVRSNRPPLRFALVAALANVAVAAAFEILRPRTLTYDGLWNARTGIWTALLLVDNLLVVWWYAVSAFRQTRAAEGALAAATQQLVLTDKEFKDNWVRARQDRKPIVFTDYDRATGKYVIRNVGGGFAMNVFGLGVESDGSYGVYRLGSLAAGAERQLRDGEDGIVAPDGIPHILLAEGVFTRTAQWNPTLNAENEWESISHDVAVADDGKTILEQRSFDEYLQKNWGTLRDQLLQFAKEAKPS